MTSSSRADGKCSGEIRKLSESVTSLIRSSVTVNSFASCVSELVCNSIDAGATCIAVRVDFSLYKIQVIDNGHGIDKNNLRFVGERYMTSKCHSLNDLKHKLDKYGFRGEALASIIKCSKRLDIVSKALASGSTYSKIFEQDAASSINPSDEQRPSAGTTVTVSDFLFNIPVRRKRVDERFDSEEMRIQMEHLAIVHCNISFSLKNDVTGKVLMESRRCSSMREVFRQIHGPVLADHLREVKFSNGSNLSVDGLISLDGHHNKSFQFIYVNKRLVLKTPMHRIMINWLSGLLKQEKKPKQPIFMLNFSCPYSSYDITLDPSKTLIQFDDWETVEKTFQGAVMLFVQQQDIHLPEDLFKLKEQRVERAVAEPTSKIIDCHLKMRRVTKGAVSRRVVSTREIVEQVLNKPQYHDEEEDDLSSENLLSAVWDVAMPKKFGPIPQRSKAKEKNESTSCQETFSTSYLELGNKTSESQVFGSTENWFNDREIEYISNKFTDMVEQSLKLLLAKLEEVPLVEAKKTQNTGLTQQLKSLDVEVEQLHRPNNDFTFVPVISEGPDAVAFGVVDDTDEDEAYYQAQSKILDWELSPSDFPDCHEHERSGMINHSYSVEEHPRPHVKVASQVSTEWATEEEDQLQILKHLSPTSEAYLKETFSSKRVVDVGYRYPTPTMEGYPQPFEEAEEDMEPFPTPQYPPPRYSINSRENTDPVGMEINAEDLTILDAPLESVNALALFADPEDARKSFFVDDIVQSSTKRKKESPVPNAVPKKQRVDLEMDTFEGKIVHPVFVNSNGCIIQGSSKEDERFVIKERHPFIPLELLPILNVAPQCDLTLDPENQQRLLSRVGESLCEADEAAVVSKWNSREEWSEEKNRLDSLIQTHIFDAGARPMPELEPNDLFNDENFAKLRRSIDQYGFQPGSLQSSKIFGQFDRKFLVALIDKNKDNVQNMVVLIDQHAAHERVRLEMLTKDYQSDGFFLTSPLHPPLNLALGKRETLAVQEFQCSFAKYGLECEAMSETEIRIFSVPLCFSKKQERQTFPGWNLVDAVERLVQELAQSLIETRGACISIPQEIRDVLNSEACSGATKFNTCLSRNACADLVKELSLCQLPFQCAHGRNSIVSVFNLDKLPKRKRAKPQINLFLKKF
ncbi:DNA mismatch repair protein Mlh3-like isoform X1 [Cloeon dipterum]|uniref:DNA mismatch repair protein Mlh3-like isoform X1 n=2 Tax=Cloeon dipterum TaxID=197152 RepID=UPI0032202DAC